MLLQQKYCNGAYKNTCYLYICACCRDNAILSKYSKKSPSVCFSVFFNPNVQQSVCLGRAKTRAFWRGTANPPLIQEGCPHLVFPFRVDLFRDWGGMYSNPSDTYTLEALTSSEVSSFVVLTGQDGRPLITAYRQVRGNIGGFFFLCPDPKVPHASVTQRENKYSSISGTTDRKPCKVLKAERQLRKS